MDVALRGMSSKALIALIAKAKKEQARKAKRQPAAAVRKKIEKAARAAGYTMAELLGTAQRSPSSQGKRATVKKSASPARRVAAKYQNPADPAQTWTGRGNQPRWLAAALKDGATLESFRIEAPSA